MLNWLEKRRVRTWRRKRSAKYLTQDVSHTRRHNGSTLVRQGNQPTAPFQKENPGEFVKYSKNLSQSHYILAEEVGQVANPAPKTQTGKAKKNNYDFLKKSQIYNKKEQEKQIRNVRLPKSWIWQESLE